MTNKQKTWEPVNVEEGIGHRVDSQTDRLDVGPGYIYRTQVFHLNDQSSSSSVALVYVPFEQARE